MEFRLSMLVSAALLTLGLATLGVLRGEPQTAQTPMELVSPAGIPSLPPVHPDEPLVNTLTQRFSLPNSLHRLHQIKGALTSFRQLTTTSKGAIGTQTLAQIANTDAETQTLGFTNWVGAVEGTLRQQDYQIKKLELELAQKQYQEGRLSQAQLTQKQAAYQKAEREFQTFVKAFKVAD